jgi:hypothetical protein
LHVKGAFLKPHGALDDFCDGWPLNSRHARAKARKRVFTLDVRGHPRLFIEFNFG